MPRYRPLLLVNPCKCFINNFRPFVKINASHWLTNPYKSCIFLTPLTFQLTLAPPSSKFNAKGKHFLEIAILSRYCSSTNLALTPKLVFEFGKLNDTNGLFTA